MVMTRIADGRFGSSDTAYLNIPIISLALGATPPDAVLTTPYPGYSYDINDDSTFSVPIPADWQSGTTISLYIRWGINEAFALGSGTIQWNGLYMTVANDMTQVVGAGTTANTSTGNINIPTLARQLRENLLVTIAAANLAVGDTIGLKVTRIAAGAAPVADAEIYAAYLSYTRFISST